MSSRNQSSSIGSLVKEILEFQQHHDESLRLSQDGWQSNFPKLRQILRRLDRTMKSVLSSSKDNQTDAPLEDLIRFIVDLDTKALVRDLVVIVTRITGNAIALLCSQQEVLPSPDDMTIMIDKIISRTTNDTLTKHWLCFVTNVWCTEDVVPNVILVSQWNIWLGDILSRSIDGLEHPFFPQSNHDNIDHELQFHLRVLTSMVLEQALLRQDENQGESQHESSVRFLYGKEGNGSTTDANSGGSSEAMALIPVFVDKCQEYTLDLLDNLAVEVHENSTSISLDVVYQCALQAAYALNLVAVVGINESLTFATQWQASLKASSTTILEVMLAVSFLENRDADSLWVEKIADVAVSASRLGAETFSEDMIVAISTRTLPYPIVFSRVFAIFPPEKCKASKAVRRVFQVALVVLRQGASDQDSLSLANELAGFLNAQGNANPKTDMWDSLVARHLSCG